MKKVCYVVWVGRQTGVFDTWNETHPHVNGFKGAKFKGFPDRASAEEAFKLPWADYIDYTRKPKILDDEVPPVEASPPAEEFEHADYSHILKEGELPF